MTYKKYTGTYSLEVWDNQVSDRMQDEIYNYLMDSEYFANFYDPPFSTYKPRKNEWQTPRTMPAAVRLPMAWDEVSLQERHPLIHALWKYLSKQILSNNFIIEGEGEAMFPYMEGVSPLSAPPKPNGLPGRPNCAWRVYGDGREKEGRSRTKEIHRDSVHLEDESNFTLVYFANKEWHPQYYGETLFHSNDDNTNSYNKVAPNDQKRGYPIGDIENVIAPRPGRVMLFDSRYLHQVKCASMYAPENIMGISFRIKKLSFT